MEKNISGAVIECIQGDIAAQADMAAVVNAANAYLRMGGGVAGAIHRTAGPGLEVECRLLAPIRPGEAVITGGHKLPNRYCIHCLGPVYGVDKPEDRLLSDCYRNALNLAEEHKIESIAFPVLALRNHPDKTCPNHRTLINLIKPGDTIINFNYDCLADDALLHFCPHWHPVTGHAFKFNDLFGGALQEKAKIFQSQVLLLKPHGSVTFRYKVKNDNETLIRLVGLTGRIQPLSMPMADGWEPFIVAPSTSKSGHHTYMEHILSLAQRKIKRAENVIVIGYSFPSNDLHVRKTLKGFEGDLTIVNPSWNSTDYKARLNDMGFTDYTGFKGFEKFLQSRANLI